MSDNKADKALDQDVAALKLFKEEIAVRLERKKQSTPGIDADGNRISRDTGLLAFIRYFWDVLEPEAKFIEGWVLDDMGRHLEAVTLGKITHLMINVSPGSMKSLLTNVFWPAWEWGPMKMPHLRYVSFAYSSGLTERDNIKFRKLVQSEKYKRLWGDVFELEKEGEIKITNNKTGSKFASSVTGIGLGERGDRVILDDPHDVKRAESDVVRTSTLEWFRGTITDRLNNPERSAIIIIMQRVHMRDICGMILDDGWDYCHMMVPEEFEPGRIPNNSLGWVDPRTEDGELAWPERRSLAFVERAKKEKGSFHYAGQYLQRPAPRSGGIIKFEHWQPYNKETAAARFGMTYPKFPPMTFTVMAVDTAQTEKKQNDPSAAVLLGVCQDAVNGKNMVMLMYAWADRLEFYELCSKVEDICKRYRVDKVIIEDKASGLPLASELRRRARVYQEKIAHGKDQFRDHANFTVQTVRPDGDKVSRAYAVQGLFESGVVWAPCDDNGSFKWWADLVMKECVIAGTMIVTRDGVVAVEDIKPGDLVLTHRGRFRPVIRTSRRNANQLVTLNPKSLSSITLTPEHPVFALDVTVERKARDGGAPQWIKAKDLKARKYVPVVRRGREYQEAKPSACHAMLLPIVRPEHPLSEIDLRDWIDMPKGGKEFDLLSSDDAVSTSHGASQFVKWRQPLDAAFGRFIGLYLAEGSSTKYHRCWSFHAKEIDLIDEIVAFVEKRLGCRARRQVKHGNCTVVGANIPLIDRFFDECGRGAENKKIPPWVWDAPDEFVRGLIEGYMDGDGYFSKRGAVRATTVSLSLAWGIRLLALRLGEHAIVGIDREATEMMIQGRLCKRLQSYLVSWQADPKHDGATLFAGDVAAYSIMATNQVVEEREVFNMDVAEDHSYCTTGGVIHNCAELPKGAHDDLVDAMVYGLKFLRDVGVALMPDDFQFADEDAMKYKRPEKAMYPGFSP